ncbi:MAG: metal ABC transporter permease [Lentisphaeria bacterium]
MMEQFMQDLQAPNSLLRLTVWAIVLASIACGIIGSYVVAKRCSYMVGAVSHSLLGGIGLARFCQLQKGWHWFSPLLGSIFAAVVVAVLISFLTLRRRQREDAVLSAIWALGMALGLSFIYAIPGYPEDLQSYLFGNILLVARRDVWLMAGMNVLILLCVWLFHNRFVCLCFHEEWLTLRGVRTGLFQLLLYLLISLTVVLLSQIVGIILCLALLILPSATAANLRRSLPAIMLLGILICLSSSLGGLMLSYHYDLPTGATIVEIIGAIYLLTAFGCWTVKKFRSLKVQALAANRS